MNATCEDPQGSRNRWRTGTIAHDHLPRCHRSPTGARDSSSSTAATVMASAHPQILP
ncbi:MAG: hypothetical protein IPI28_07340 [Candidatus Omnitrophica bacterium]|nr:hypothetical protein [Candidatus Omnitrophota bacterium]